MSESMKKAMELLSSDGQIGAELRSKEVEARAKLLQKALSERGVDLSLEESKSLNTALLQQQEVERFLNSIGGGNIEELKAAGKAADWP